MSAQNRAKRWGVYDQHTREWIVPADLPRERDAWKALLAVDSLHPWELEIRSLTECPECYSTGECDSCGRECLRCDGAGEVPWDDLTDRERESQKLRGVAPAAGVA